MLTVPALALFEPDIPQNLGAIMRLSACFGMVLHIIEPCGFPLDDKRIKRAGMDYIAHVVWQRHASWEAFYDWSREHNKRLLLLTTKASEPYDRLNYQANDILLFGRESAGVPEHVHAAVDGRLTIPMHQDVRSLNLAMSAAIVSGEVMRQLRKN
jgi:tRNA (cytidine/uridine-2'-O-)-methyltransferase